MHIYKEKISVVISSYNAEKTLAQALDALENQDIAKEKFEVIIVDDGSTDNSKNLIHSYIQKGTCSLHYYYQSNQWVGKARNYGIQHAQGDILAFTDADCICDKDWLSIIEKTLRQENKKFIWWETYCNDTVIFPRKMAPVHHLWVTANLALDRKVLPDSYILFNLWFSGMLGDDIDLVLSLHDLWIPLVFVPEMKVQHPANILTFERFLIRRKGRMNEVGLYKKHGKKTLDCFSPIYKPRIFGRISLFTVAILLATLWAILIWQLYGVWWIIYTAIGIFVLFIGYGYKALVIHQPQGQIITIWERIKTFFYFLLTIPLFFIARIRGMVKFHFFLL